MFINSNEEMNRLKKEKNRLLIKEIWNIYLKTTIEKNWRYQTLDFLGLKNLLPGHFLLQLMLISLNFKTFCYNLKIKVLRTRLCVAFLSF